MVWSLTAEDHLPIEEQDPSDVIANCLKSDSPNPFTDRYWLTETEAIDAAIRFHSEKILHHCTVIQELTKKGSNL